MPEVFEAFLIQELATRINTHAQHVNFESSYDSGNRPTHFVPGPSLSFSMTAAYELTPIRSGGDPPFLVEHQESDPAQLLNEQRQNALREMNEAPFSWVFFSYVLLSCSVQLLFRRWFHVKVILVAGAGFFTDA